MNIRMQFSLTLAIAFNAGSVGVANADLPTDEEYMSMHFALAEVCSKLIPEKAAQIDQGAAVLVCDLTNGTKDRREQFKKMQESANFQRLKDKTIAQLHADPASARNACTGLTEYPENGQFCSLVSKKPAVASPRKVEP